MWVHILQGMHTMGPEELWALEAPLPFSVFVCMPKGHQ